MEWVYKEYYWARVRRLSRALKGGCRALCTILLASHTRLPSKKSSRRSISREPLTLLMMKYRISQINSNPATNFGSMKIKGGASCYLIKRNLSRWRNIELKS